MSEGQLWLVAGVVVGVVAVRRLVALPAVSDVLFGGFDKREIDAIVNDPTSYGSGSKSYPVDEDGWQ